MISKIKAAELVLIFLTGLSTAQAGTRWKTEQVVSFLSEHACSFTVYDESDRLIKDYNLNQLMAAHPDKAVVRNYEGDEIGAIQVSEYSTFLSIPVVFPIAVISFETGSQGMALHIAKEAPDVGSQEWHWMNVNSFVKTNFTYTTQDLFSKQKQVFRCD